MQDFDSRMDTGAVFLDVAKAFDKVWHQGLVYKMYKTGFKMHIIKLIASYLNNRKFQVKLLDTLSAERDIQSGVPQGSILGPILFNIFLYDLILNQRGMLALYADDVAVLYKSKSTNMITKYLQEMLDTLYNWYTKWRIAINTEKSVAIYFSRRLKRDPDDIKYGENIIEWQQQIKYLGLTFDKRLTWCKHVHDKVATTKKIMGMLTSLSHQKRPHMLYAAPVWSSVSDTNFYHLQVLQNRYLRRIALAPWFIRTQHLHEELNVPMIRDYVRTLAETFYQQVEIHPCRSVVELTTYD